MILSGPDRDALTQEIANVYDTAELKQIVSKLGKRWDFVTVDNALLPEHVLNIIQKSEKEGWLRDFIIEVAARREGTEQQPFVERVRAILKRYPELSSVPTNRGNFAYIICDRDEPIKEFRKAVKPYLVDPNPTTRNIQFFVVHGSDDDCPGSFVDRVEIDEILKLGEMYQPSRWSEHPRVRRTTVNWRVASTDDIKDAITDLQDEIIRDIRRDDSSRLDKTTSHENLLHDLVSLTCNNNLDVVIVHHEVVIDRWSVKIEEVLSTYINLLSTMPSDSPLFLMFFTMKHINPLYSFPGFRKVKKTMHTIKKVFSHSETTCPHLVFSVLKRLDKVDKSSVELMVRKIKNTVTDTEVDNFVNPLFKRRKKVRMREIEKHFSKSHPMEG